MTIPFHDRRTGQVLYHGTTADLKPGDIVKPGIEIGHESEREQAYASPSFPSAYRLAHDQNYWLWQKLGDADSPMRMFRVKPVDPDEIEVSGPKHMTLTSRGRIDVPEVTSKKGFVVQSEVPNPARVAAFHEAVGRTRGVAWRSSGRFLGVGSGWFKALEAHRANADGTHSPAKLERLFPQISMDEEMLKHVEIMKSCPACKKVVNKVTKDELSSAKEEFK